MLIFPFSKNYHTSLTQGDMLEITQLIRNTFYWVESSNHLVKMGVLRWVQEVRGKGAQSLSKTTNEPTNQPKSDNQSSEVKGHWLGWV